MEGNVVSKNKIYEIAVQIMYSFLIMQNLENSQPVNFEEIVSSVCDKPYKDCDLLLKELLIKSLKYENEIIDKIKPYLRDWTFERLNTCVQSILIISLANFYYCENKEKAIVIDVAVRLAKKYGEEKDYKFVNAILDNCLNE